MKNNSMIVTILLLIIVGGAAFFGGMQYQKSQRPANGQFGQGNFNRQGGARNGARGFGGATVGEVVSMDTDSITLKLMDGSSKIINVSSTTTFSKTATGSKTDVKTGDRIAAIGSANSDGSISAQNIQLNPMFRTGSRPSGAPAPSM